MDKENKIATLAVDNGGGATDWKFCCNQCWYWK